MSQADFNEAVGGMGCGCQSGEMGCECLGLSPISWTKKPDTEFDDTQYVRRPNRRWHHPRQYQTLEDEFAGPACSDLQNEVRQGLYGDAVNVDGHFGVEQTVVAAQPFTEQRVVIGSFLSQSTPMMMNLANDALESKMLADQVVAAARGDELAAAHLLQQRQAGALGPMDLLAVDQATAETARKYRLQDVAFGLSVAVVLLSLFKK